MVGRPRQNRASIKGTHVSIRLTEKEVAALDALITKADAQTAEQHQLEQKLWDQRSEAAKALLARSKPKRPKPTTYADIVRALLQQEAQQPRLYEKNLWTELREDTVAVDRLVDLANDKEHPAYRWTRETMLRKLVEDEFGRRRLKTSGIKRRRRGTMRAMLEKQWQQEHRASQPGAGTPLAICPDCGGTFELPPR
jgi:hypothetical protein